MSSYNSKISAKNVRISEHSKALNDRLYVDEDTFEDVYVEGKRLSAQERIKKLELQMMQELEEKKQAFIDQAYKEGKERALEEAEQKVRTQMQNTIDQAHALFEQASQYRKQVIEETEKEKRQWYENNKEACLSLIVDLTETIIYRHIPVESLGIDKMYEEAIKNVTYDTKKIYVRVHPSVKKWVEEKAFGPDDNRIEVFYDGNIRPGDLFIETDMEYINASVANKLEQLKAKLRGVVNDSY